MMPEKNIFFENVKPFHHVELRGTQNKFWVVIVDGVEHVAIMDGQKQREQQKWLDELCRATKMRAKGYRYMVCPTDESFEPLYVKTANQVGPLMRDYPNTHFVVHNIVDK